MLIKLTDMKRGNAGIVSDIGGGRDVSRRIQNMGMRLGKKIKKIEGHHKKGPQTVLITHFKIAIGFGMAEKIIIEIEEK